MTVSTPNRPTQCNKPVDNVNTQACRFSAIDADRHIIETEQLWREILPPALYQSCQFETVDDTPHAMLGRIQRLGNAGATVLPTEQKLKGQPLLNNWGEPQRLTSTQAWSSKLAAVQQATTPSGQLASMDEGEIGTAHLFPTYGGLVINNQFLSSEESVAIAKAYNTWLYDYCRVNPQRLRAVGVISRHAPEQMLSQLQQVIDFGWRSITLRPEPIAGRTLGHKDYEPFWAACAEQGIAIALHGGTHLQGSTVGIGRFNTRFALHACSHLMEAQMAFLALLEGGVLERHPTLKVAFLEAGAGWLPSWLWRLDNLCYKNLPDELKGVLSMLPSDYFKRQCWIGFEPDEPGLREVVNTIGVERLLFGTDFPHPDHDNPASPAATCEHLFNNAELKAILEANPKAFFG